MMSLPPGACPGGQTERADGMDAGSGSVPGRGRDPKNSDKTL
jgi:hypothetical protein